MQAQSQISSWFSYLLFFLLNIMIHHAYSQDESLNSPENKAERIELYTNLSALVSGHCGPEIGLSYFTNEDFHFFGSAKYAFYQLFDKNPNLDNLTQFHSKLNYGVEFKIGVGYRVAPRNTFLRPFVEFGSFQYELQARKCVNWELTLWEPYGYCTCNEVSNFKSQAGIFRIGLGLELISTVFEFGKFRFDMGISGQLNYLKPTGGSFTKVKGYISKFDYELTPGENYWVFHGVQSGHPFDNHAVSILPRFLFRLTYQL
jgi:hypothetical protein